MLNEKKIYTDLFLYYSLKDLTYGFGFKNMMPYDLEKKPGLVQRRNISGKIEIEQNYGERGYDLVFKIRDLCGLHPGGLKDLAKSVSLEKIDKFDPFKSNMDQALLTQPDLFIEYAMNDALLLPNIFEKKIVINNTI